VLSTQISAMLAVLFSAMPLLSTSLRDTVSRLILFFSAFRAV
jgi:hypothetical protein